MFCFVVKQMNKKESINIFLEILPNNLNYNGISELININYNQITFMYWQNCHNNDK